MYLFQNVWERWSLEDSARAELPLTEDHDETYPAGIAVDFTSRLPIQLGKLANNLTLMLVVNFTIQKDATKSEKLIYIYIYIYICIYIYIYIYGLLAMGLFITGLSFKYI